MILGGFPVHGPDLLEFFRVFDNDCRILEMDFVENFTKFLVITFALCLLAFRYFGAGNLKPLSVQSFPER